MTSSIASGSADRSGFVGAADIGATKTLVTVRAWPVEAWALGSSEVVRLATDRDPWRMVARLADELTRLAIAGGAVRGRLDAVGLAAPGPLDPTSGVIHHSPNLGWRDVPISGPLKRLLGVPIVLDDDARTGALGEARLGAGRGRATVAYVTLGSGVGGGIIMDGRLHRGAHNVAGEVGHLSVDPTGPRCGCGRRGCVEAFVGGSSLARRARGMWPSARTADGTPAPRDAAEVFRAARAGDPAAGALVDEAVEALGFAAIGAVLDPDLIVVGGSIGLSQRRFVRRAVTVGRQRCLAQTGRALTVVPAALGRESVLAGAAVTAWETLPASRREAL
jgi:glucokinase